MRLLHLWPRQWGKRRALDLVRRELEDLEKRSQEAAEARKPRDPYYETMMQAIGAWCAPDGADYKLVDLPTVGIQQGGIVR